MKFVLNMILSMMISYAVGVFFGKKYRYEKKQMQFNYVWNIGISVIWVILYEVFGREAYSYYGSLLGLILISTILSGIVFPLIRRKKVTLRAVLLVVCLSAVSIAIYSSLTYGQLRLHSDTATTIILLEAQKESKSILPASWCYVNDELWIIEMNLWTLPFYAIMGSMVRARVMGTALALVVTIAVVILFSKKYWKNDSWIISIPVILLFLRDGTDILDKGFINSVADNILYQGGYLTQLMCLPLTILLGYSFLSKEKKKRLLFGVLYSVLMIILCMGGVRQLAELLLPMIGATGILFYIENRECTLDKNLYKKLRRFFLDVVCLIIPALVGEIVYKILASRHYLSTLVEGASFVPTINDCWNNTITAFTNFYAAFGYSPNVELFSLQGIRNGLSAVACTLLIFIVPLLQMRKLQDEKRQVQFFFAFTVVHNLIMILMAIWCGYTTPRYLLTSVFLCILISARYIWNYWILAENFQSVCWGGAFTLTTIIMAGFILVLSKGWTKTLDAKLEFIQTLEQIGVTKGYANYWYAYNNDVYSDMKLDISGVSISGTSITPYKWLVDSNKFCENAPSSFLMLSEEENSLIADQIENICGTPKDLYVIEGMYIYVFDYDIMRYHNGALDGEIAPLEMRINEQCQVTEKQVTLNQDGVVTCPALDMMAGDYLIEVYGENLDATEYNVYSYLSDLLSWEEIGRTNECITLRVHNKDRGADIKVDLVNYSDQIVNVQCMKIKNDDK